MRHVLGLFVLLTSWVLPGPLGHAGVLDFPPYLIEQAEVSGSATVIRNAPRAYLGYSDEQIYASQVSQPVLIVGMQFRLAIGDNWKIDTGAPGSSWPVEDLDFDRYNVWLGEASAPVRAAGWLDDTLSFADNMSNVVHVRSGGWTIPAHSFQATGGSTGVHAWGPTISFSTPYLYEPGETLVYLIRHSGVNQVNTVGANFASRYSAPNYTDCDFNTDENAAGALPYTTQVHYVRFLTAPVPEPSALASLLALPLLLCRRRG